MKTWINHIYILAILSLVLFSCEKDEDRVIMQLGAPSALSTTSSTLVLEKANASTDALTLSWAPTNYGFDAAVRYTLQVDKKGNNFATPKNVELANGLQKKYTVSELNSLLIQLGIVPGAAGQVEARVKSDVVAAIQSVYSPVITITATPYAVEVPPLPVLYMVGDATEGGWDNKKAPRMFNSEANPNIFVYTGFLKAGSLKFLAKSGAWAPQYGSNGSGGVAYRPDENTADPASFSIAADGYYAITFDVEAVTMVIQPFDVTGKPAFTSIGLIGSFGNPEWDKIDPMTNTVFNPHIWMKEYTFGEDVEAKFRIAENWDFEWGATNAEGQSLLYGKGAKGNPNIKLTAGKYDVMFNDLTGNYVFVRK